MARLKMKGTVVAVSGKSDKPTDSDMRRLTPQYEGKHRLWTSALTDAQLEELMARFRERFRLTDS